MLHFAVEIRAAYVVQISAVIIVLTIIVAFVAISAGSVIAALVVLCTVPIWRKLGWSVAVSFYVIFYLCSVSAAFAYLNYVRAGVDSGVPALAYMAFTVVLIVTIAGAMAISAGFIVAEKPWKRP